MGRTHLWLLGITQCLLLRFALRRWRFEILVQSLPTRPAKRPVTEFAWPIHFTWGRRSHITIDPRSRVFPGGNPLHQNHHQELAPELVEVEGHLHVQIDGHRHHHFPFRVIARLFSHLYIYIYTDYVCWSNLYEKTRNNDIFLCNPSLTFRNTAHIFTAKHQSCGIFIIIIITTFIPSIRPTILSRGSNSGFSWTIRIIIILRVDLINQRLEIFWFRRSSQGL